MAKSFADTARREIHPVFCLRIPDDASGFQILQSAAGRNARFGDEVVATARDGRLAADRLVRFPFGDADLGFRGPTGLKDGVLKDLGASTRSLCAVLICLRCSPPVERPQHNALASRPVKPELWSY